MADRNSKELEIKTRTRVADVQQATGFNDLGWRTFNRLTRMQAEAIAAQEGSPSWTIVAYHEKIRLLLELNEKLEQEGLPQVNEKVYSRRMAQALAPMIRQSKQGKRKRLGLPEGQASTDVTEAESLPGAGCTRLPPIRDHPDLAQHLHTNNDQDLSEDA
ncbi:hypothetical protein LTR78_007426 [Recurvomyces mirabilis]|uniref:Uncharacterized protein n=1 Tax=Recurvomyces mirabilis TaxID=574656 RepID=A0AAE0TRR0_9PEZI|nr:hypothetical protein LTR78_007426 [Recurvomyces mirabilis]KAK5160065.1 hypothetical protein LTS14_002171 [Recurvomyces mirabilis]